MVGMVPQLIEVFFSYSRKDKELRDELDTHLALLKRRGVTTWHDCQIVAGSEWEGEINRRIKTADIILLLISSDFIASNYCYEKELPDILKRHEAREAYVIPVLLRPVAGWKQSPFAKLQICPTGGLPVTQWKDKDAAFVDVADSIEEAVNKLLEKRDRDRQEQERRVQEGLRLEKEQERLRAEEIQRQREEQRQEQLRTDRDRQAAAEKARLAEEAKRAEEARRAERARQTVPSTRAQPIGNAQPLVTPVPQTADPTRRQVLKWLGFGGGTFALAVAGQKIWGNGRSPQPQLTNSSEPVRSPTQPQPLPASSSITDLKGFSFEVATVNAKGEEVPRQTKEANAFVEDLGNGVTLEMVAIPGGTFQMGSPTDEKGRDDDESPQHKVTVPAFFMGRYAVTQAQYEGIMGKNSSNFKGAKCPVETVSWNDAQEFCKKLSQKTGRTYRLPSEAEWEYACRAGTTTPFHYGETITTDLANYRGTGWHFGRTTEVGSFPPNAFGLYDMHGNVWEWCEDVYHKKYEGAPTNGSAWSVGGEQATRLLRGGSWSYYAGDCRSANRIRLLSDGLDQNVGFRMVAVLA